MQLPGKSAHAIEANSVLVVSNGNMFFWLKQMAILEERYFGEMSCRTQHRMCKYLNNIVEQDHRFIKKKTNQMLGFESFETAKSTISGIEIMHMIYKGQVEEIQCVLSEVKFINTIMDMAA